MIQKYVHIRKISANHRHIAFTNTEDKHVIQSMHINAQVCAWCKYVHVNETNEEHAYPYPMMGLKGHHWLYPNRYTHVYRHG